MDPLRKNIASLKEQIAQFDQVRAYLDQLLVKRRKQQARMDRLQIWARQELEDVTKLEKNGKNTRNKNGRFDQESAMEKEKEEYLAVMRKVKAAEHDIHLLDFEIGVLREKLDKLPHLQAALKELHLQREKEILQSSEDTKLKKLATSLENTRQKKARTGAPLEWLEQSLVYLDEIKRHFESMMLLPNWQMLPESKIQLAEDELDRVQVNIVEIKKILNSLKEDWLVLAQSLPPNTLPSLRRIHIQMNALQQNAQDFRDKLNKPSHLNRFLHPAQQLVFKIRSDLEQAIQELQVEMRQLEAEENNWEEKLKKRIKKLLD